MDEWDDELSELPVDRRRIALRRGAYLSLCAGLITLIILTILFVGNDTTTVAAVGTDGSTSTTSGPSTTGFSTSLPVGVTATSLSDTTTTTTTTLVGTVVLPRQGTTSSTTTTTTLPPPPPFQFNPHPRTNKAMGSSVVGGDPACVAAPVPDESFTFDNAPGGKIKITRAFTGQAVVITVDSNGNWTGTFSAGTEHYSNGHATNIKVTASYAIDTCGPVPYTVTWMLA